MNQTPTNTKGWAEWLKLSTHDDEDLIALVQECARFALNFKAGGKARWLTLLGKSGTGKTHCARRLWNHTEKHSEWRKAAFVQSEVYWPAFVSELRSGEAYARLHDMQKWPVLFLDDVGAERDTTGFASEQLNTLLGCRADKWTILTSNLTLGQFRNVDARIADRIIRYPNQFIEVNTKSYALRNITLQTI